jgi:hypothetical protein
MILPRVNNSTTDSNKGGMDETQKNWKGWLEEWWIKSKGSQQMPEWIQREYK